jgi:hypothetical protein
MEKITVLTLWRNAERFDPQIIQAVKDCFPDTELDFVRSEPTDRRNYEEVCATFQPRVVILPRHSIPFSVLPLVKSELLALEIDEPPYMGLMDTRDFQLVKGFDPYKHGNFSYENGKIIYTK